jgi:hypothetical protein
MAEDGRGEKEQTLSVKSVDNGARSIHKRGDLMA